MTTQIDVYEKRFLRNQKHFGRGCCVKLSSETLSIEQYTRNIGFITEFNVRWQGCDVVGNVQITSLDGSVRNFRPGILDSTRVMGHPLRELGFHTSGEEEHRLLFRKYVELFLQKRLFH